LSASYRITDGPLQPGSYRYTISSALADRFGNPLVEPYVRTFEVVPLVPFVIENRSNDTRGAATPLVLAEVGAGLSSGYGRGNLWSTSDIDYYSFSGVAGQVLVVGVEVPGNPSNSQLYYRVDRPDGSYLTDFYATSNNGWGQSARITLPVSGTYTVFARYNYDYQGEYRLRVDLADPPMQLEIEPNSGVSNATPLSFTVSGDNRTATVGGAILPAGELDYFNLGTVSAGETIFLTSRVPGTSSLDPVVAVYNASNGYMVESGSGRPFDGVAQVNITQTGTYFAVMRGGNNAGGLTAQYLLDVNIVPTGSVDFPNLQVTSVALPGGGPFLSGQSVTFDYTVTNVGSQPTNTGNWSDKVVLVAEHRIRRCRRCDAGRLRAQRHPRPGRFLHRGPDGQPAPRHFGRLLPAGRDRHQQRGQRVPAGGRQRHRLGRHDPRQPGPYPDLRVEDLMFDAPTAEGVYTVSWTTANRGTGEAPGGFKERIVVRHVASGATVADHEITVADSLAADGTVPHSRDYTFTLPGTHRVIVTTDSQNQIFEFTTGGHAAAEQNNTAQADVEVTLDLQVTAASSTASTAAVGEVISVSYTVHNQGTATAAADWSDRFYLSSDPTWDAGDVLVGTQAITSQTPLEPGGSYQITRDLTIPGTAPLGTLYLLFVVDALGQQSESDESNNVRSVPITIGAPDLAFAALPTAPESAAAAETIAVAWTVRNDGQFTAFADWVDRVYLSDNASLDAGDTLLDSTTIATQTPLAAGDSYTILRNVTIPNTAGVGGKFLLFVIDAANAQRETDETNNIAAAAILLGGPDLTVTAASAPGEVAMNQAVGVTWTVQNIDDTYTAGADWSDRVYLSSDDVWDAATACWPRRASRRRRRCLPAPRTRSTVR
jgi:hypothetical protein